MRKVAIEYRVPYADTDQMGVVYYANYLVFFERVRNELLRDYGFPYTEIEDIGIRLPVLEAVCKYIEPARYDDLITIIGKVDELRGVRIKISCEVYREDTLLVHGHTTHAFVGEHGKPVKPPKRLVNLINAD
jgi:acyl-CoA thioester hydrolase